MVQNSRIPYRFLLRRKIKWDWNGGKLDCYLVCGRSPFFCFLVVGMTALKVTGKLSNVYKIQGWCNTPSCSQLHHLSACWPLFCLYTLSCSCSQLGICCLGAQLSIELKLPLFATNYEQDFFTFRFGIQRVVSCLKHLIQMADDLTFPPFLGEVLKLTSRCSLPSFMLRRGVGWKAGWVSSTERKDYRVSRLKE